MVSNSLPLVGCSGGPRVMHSNAEMFVIDWPLNWSVSSVRLSASFRPMLLYSSDSAAYVGPPLFSDTAPGFAHPG